MKRIYTLLASMAILLAVGIVKANAQVVDVCAGNDTVELRLENFQYGYVQWQVSDDNETWMDIDGAVDTVYRFLPERPRYYRAEVKFPQCSEYDYHSQVTYVQIPPVADAGPDFATSPNMPVRLAASRFEGAVGEWSIIEGPFGGVFDNNSDPHALFMGSEGEYKLVWTLTNSCGSSTDTINVSCIPTVYNSNILIVDETDVILSDTLQMLNGEYSIVFTDTIPNIIEGTVLIGYREKPFLRKVTSFEKVGDVFVMQTEQATLADVVVSGAMCIDPIGDLDEGSKRVKVLDRYPTRKELVANPSLLNDGTICVIKGDYSKENMDDPEDPPIDLSFKIDDGKIELSAKINFKILDPDCDGLILKFEGEATPNFRINPKYEDQDMAKFSIGFYDNEVKHTIKLYAEKELNGIVVEGKGNINPHQLIIGGFLLFGVPTTVTLDFPYSAEASATIGGLEIEHTISYTNTHAVEWRDWGLEEVVKKSEPVKETKPFHITGNLEGKIEVGLKIGLLVADMVGPSVTVNGHFGPSLCYSITNPHTLTAELGWGVDSKIGGRLQLFSNKLGVNFEGHKTLYEDSEKAPKELVRAGGDQQVYNPMDFDFIQSGGFLPDDIKVNVKGWFGTNMPFAIVHFEPEEGDEVSDERVIANIHGIASVKWKPGSASGQHKLKARVFDCEGKPMAGSPLVFHAYTQGTGGCWNSGLTADFIEHVSSNGTKTIEFLVTGGEEPYEYSTDGINFDPLLQTISLIPQPGHTYVYYVRDKYGCEAEAYYNAPFDACDASTFALNVQVYNGNNIAVEAQGGIEPYWYSLDGINYSSNFGSPLPFYYFTNLVDGEYTVYAKDGLGCMRTQTVTIQREANIGIVITNAGFDMFGSPVGTVQMLASVPVIYDRGICWAEKTNASVPPTVEDFTRSYGSGSDDYDFTLQGLNSGTTYYVRAYILTDAGTAYSNTIEMMANYMVTKPYVYVTAVSSLTNNSANCSSNVINDGNAEVTDRGFCWSATNPSPTLADSHLSCGTGTGIFSGTLTDLESHTHYYIRAYATNSQGTGYGLPNQFYTSQNGGGGSDHEYVDLGLPSGLLWATCNVGANSPEEYGDYFAWGETQPKDVYNWSTYHYCMGSNTTLTKYCNNPDYGYNGYHDNLFWLQPEDDAATANWGNEWRVPSNSEWWELYTNTTVTWITRNGVKGRLFTSTNGNSIFLPAAGYYYESNLHGVGDEGDYWANWIGTEYSADYARYLYFTSSYCGNSCSFRFCGNTIRPVHTTSPSTNLPEVTTLEIFNITSTSAEFGGNVVSDGGFTVTERGVCWSTGHYPLAYGNHASSGFGTGSFSVNAIGLNPNTTYYVRAYAINEAGTSYGDEVEFTTLGGGGSIGGHVYVDLGLPSGTMWASCNVGANLPEEGGGFFAWGETSPKFIYHWGNYQHGTYDSLTKYCDTDNLTILLPEDDAATANWGADWRMPTKEEWEELLNNTTNVWITLNDEYGRLFTGSNGNSIFLPAAGFMEDNHLYGAGGGGNYSSSSRSDVFPRESFGCYFTSEIGDCGMGRSDRYFGESVRAVRSIHPQVFTSEVAMFNSLSATCEGFVNAEGGATVTERGICWGTSHNPDFTCNHIVCGSGVGTFTGNLSGLSQKTHYYARAYAINNTGVSYGNEVEFTTLGGIGEHGCVDLGLPSGTLWATCNVGADTPEESGGYFAWAETFSKTKYNWKAYKYCKYGSDSQLTKYCNNPSQGYNGFTDNLTILLPEDDVATISWGSDWRIPTEEEWQELFDNTTFAWTNQNGVNGLLLTALNGNNLFLPAAGYGWNSEIYSVGYSGNYWSSSLYLDNPSRSLGLDFMSNTPNMRYNERYYGRSIRPVRSARQK